MSKLWQKNEEKLDKFVEAFETKDDLLMDQKLVPYDIKGSLAHAKGLFKIGILSKKELKQIEQGLGEIQELYESGEFLLELGDEDMHTKIENYLTKEYGEVGKKIHTGRSRNDQVLTAIRLFIKEYLAKIEIEVSKLTGDFKAFADKYGQIPMPGYTHMHKAMPSSLKIWAESFIASLEDDTDLLKVALKLSDRSPLGSGAGFGVPLDLDRKFTAKVLGFAKVLENPLYCQNSRGKVEGVTLASLIQILQTINKFASDVMLFSTAEFNFFSVSEEITTGSSIMPQKKNVDIAELLRSKLHLVLGNYIALISLSSNLISGYNRDLQDSKKPLIESLEITLNSLKAAQILIKNITPKKLVLEEAMTEELFAAEKALELVKIGVPFREAYLKVKGGGK
ncbi:argininosuccinate lyase [Candidatus Daviesbacteria bacterium]|nr:argininosuccinate lyase [Candidatus Daviesbacteria bacterium]